MVKLRKVKKEIDSINYAGTEFSILEFDRQVQKAWRLKIGTPVFNPYFQMWETLKAVQWDLWDYRDYPFRKHRRLAVSWQCPILVTNTGYMIYDLRDAGL